VSTRARLTLSYALILLGTVLAFAVAIWRGQAIGAKQTLADDAFRFADDIFAAIARGQVEGTRLTVVDSTDTTKPPIIRTTKEMADLLDPYPGYFMVLDQNGKLLYSSAMMRMLGADDQLTILTNALKINDSTGFNVRVREDSVSLFAVGRRSNSVGPNIARVITALPTSLAELAPQLLIGTIIVVAPIIFLFSMVVAYLVVGRAFQPVDQLINEVEAITDGRSLHRRLPADSSNDELSRLSITVNAMLTRLEGSFAALRRFTADASHELKTPLTVLRADVERAMHPGTNRSERMVALEEALQETARMSDLVNSLLTLARADEGRFDIYREPIELEPLMREVYETAVILGEDAGLTLSLAALEDGIVMGDRARLRQLFLNLVTNAIKYTPRGGRVELSVTRRGSDEIVVVVRDTGIGIAANDLPHVFDRFWRADRVRSRASERGGFGLGLAICQWIVQAHGGAISVQSRLGRGSIFTVQLPIVAAAPPVLPMLPAAHEPSAVEAAETAVESADS
jgi:signal transduction histidine kinase